MRMGAMGSRGGFGSAGVLGTASNTWLFDLNFATQTAWPRPFTTELVETRSSNQYVPNASGLLVQKSATVLPISDAYMLIEPAATNLALQSNTLDNASWAKTNATISANTTAAPDGTTTADTLTGSASAAQQHQLSTASISFTNAIVYTGSVEIAAGTAQFAQLTFGAGAFSGLGYANFDLVNGTVTQTGGTLVSATITPTYNGFYLCTLTATATATASTSFAVYQIQSGVATRAPNGPNAQTTIGWGGQVEAASAASSRVVTTTAAATRAANAVTVQRTGVRRVVYTFDDNSQQTASGIEPTTQYTIPTNLNRRLIKRMTGYAADLYPYFTQDGSTWPWYGYATQPSSMYVAATNKTWVSWLAWSGYSQEIRVAVYDHAAKTWSRTYLAGDVLETDDHCVPSLCRDSDGYIYCFHGPHNQNMQVTRSKNVDDPSSWTPLPEIAGAYTYPHPSFIGGKIYLFMRTYLSGRFPLVLRVGTVSGGSISWAAEKTVLDWSSKRCYQGNHIIIGTDIHFVLAWADVNDTTRQNAYYCIYNTTDGSVRNFSGSTSVASGSQPINLTTADASFKIVDQSGASHEGNIPQFCYDTNGKPHVTYMDGASGGPYSLLHVMSNDGSTWTAPETIGSFSTGGNHRYDGHCVAPLSGGDIEAYWVDTGSSFTRGGDIARSQRLSGAWSTKTTIQAAGTKALDVPTTVRDNTDEFRVALCEISNTPSGNQGWAYGASGFVQRNRDPVRTFTMATEHLFDRMTVAPSAARQTIYDTLIRSLQTGGLWDVIDGLYLCKAHDRQAARLNIRKGLWDLAETDTANLTFTTDGYFAGNGTSSLLTAACVPSTLLAQGAATGTANILRYGQNSAHVFGAVNNLGDAAAAFGFDDLTNGYRAVANLNATQLVARLNEATDVTYTVGAGTGFAGITRVDATNVSANVGGSAQGPTAAASQGSPTVGFTVCGLGSASSNRQVTAAGYGSGLTAAQLESLRTIVNTYLTAF